ncbi:MAG: hypothetical protein KME45_03200 [Stenomitos rutilans HA7619-LM2]|jgi:hypothetical protein|nr:hypothetical protein [Stenomitos rutilans HA7619-LM2]MBW4469392.1 hypothetical protein [Stenomitos rutilans HA7619-LM2]
MGATTASKPRTENLTRETVVFDGGNRTIQWIDALGMVHTIPSFIKFIDPTWQEIEPSLNSVVIEHEGQTFVLGQAAKEENGKPIFEAGKISLAPKLVLAALEPNRGETAVRIERLLLALPSSRVAEDLEILKSIEGTHEFSRNGQSIVATVVQVVPVDETKAAYAAAARDRLFRSESKLNGVLDLGGGTAIARLYKTDGSIKRDMDVILQGTDALAEAISARITHMLGHTVPAWAIMDGIERGDYAIGEGGQSFKPAFDFAHAEWLTNIRQKIGSKWKALNQSGQIGEVMIIGGSAPLAKPLEELTKGRFFVSDMPQVISIRSMPLL